MPSTITPVTARASTDQTIQGNAPAATRATRSTAAASAAKTGTTTVTNRRRATILWRRTDGAVVVVLCSRADALSSRWPAGERERKFASVIVNRLLLVANAYR